MTASDLPTFREFPPKIDLSRPRIQHGPMAAIPYCGVSSVQFGPSFRGRRPTLTNATNRTSRIAVSPASGRIPGRGLQRLSPQLNRLGAAAMASSGATPKAPSRMQAGCEAIEIIREADPVLTIVVVPGNPGLCKYYTVIDFSPIAFKQLH